MGKRFNDNEMSTKVIEASVCRGVGFLCRWGNAYITVKIKINITMLFVISVGQMTSPVLN